MCGGSDCKCERVRTLACAQLRAVTHRLLLHSRAGARARAGQTATTTATLLGALRRLENCRRVVKIRLLADEAVALLGAGKPVALRTLAERCSQEIFKSARVCNSSHNICYGLTFENYPGVQVLLGAGAGARHARAAGLVAGAVVGAGAGRPRRSPSPVPGPHSLHAAAALSAAEAAALFAAEVAAPSAAGAAARAAVAGVLQG